jgi:dihydrofolate reductase
VPVFVLTHHPRETVAKQGGTSFIFVTDGLESALAQARQAAGDKDVAVAVARTSCSSASTLDFSTKCRSTSSPHFSARA